MNMTTAAPSIPTSFSNPTASSTPVASAIASSPGDDDEEETKWLNWYQKVQDRIDLIDGLLAKGNPDGLRELDPIELNFAKDTMLEYRKKITERRLNMLDRNTLSAIFSSAFRATHRRRGGERR